MGKMPSLVITSLWQTPHAATFTRTLPGPGSGMGRSRISMGPWAAVTWATRMVPRCPKGRSRCKELKLSHFLNGLAGVGGGDWGEGVERLAMKKYIREMISDLKNSGAKDFVPA